MADKRYDHPDEKTLSARFDRTFGRDEHGNSGLSIFFSEATNDFFFGGELGAFVFIGCVLAAGSFVGGNIYSSFADLDIPVNHDLSGKLNLINGYSIMDVQGEKIALIRHKNGEFGLFTLHRAHGDLEDEWRLISQPEQAAEYAKMVQGYLSDTLEDKTYTGQNSEGKPVYNIKARYSNAISVPYVNNGDDPSVFIDMDTYGVQLDESQHATYTQRSLDFWTQGAQQISRDSYGPSEPLQLSDDYYYWNHVGDGAKALGGAGLAFWLLAAGVSGAGTARKRVRAAAHKPSRR